MLLTVGAWSAFAGGLLATGKTVAENEAVWGKPVAIQTFSDGMEKRFYKINNTMNINYRSFTYKDGRAMNEGNINESIPEAPAQPAQYKVLIF